MGASSVIIPNSFCDLKRCVRVCAESKPLLSSFFLNYYFHRQLLCILLSEMAWCYRLMKAKKYGAPWDLIICNALGFLSKRVLVLIYVCSCFYCIWSSREDIIAASWPISRPQPAAPLRPLRFMLISLTLSLFADIPSLNRSTSPSQKLRVFSPGFRVLFCFAMLSLVLLFFKLLLLFPICPLFNSQRLSSLSHLLCIHLVTWPVRK